jgi:hypothetical protein
MYAITGITGKVKGALARTLLAASQPVRSVVLDTTRVQPWAERGWEEARGFNEGWIDYKGEKATALNGQVNLETLLGALVLEAG